MTAAAPTALATRTTFLRRAVLALLGFAAAGAVGASAASLGGLATSTLGAGGASGFSHPAGVDVRWAPVFSGGLWRVSAIEVITRGSEQFAVGERVRLALLRADGVALCEFTRTVTAVGSTQLAIPSAEVAAACGQVAFSTLDRIAIAIGT